MCQINLLIFRILSSRIERKIGQDLLELTTRIVLIILFSPIFVDALDCLDSKKYVGRLKDFYFKEVGPCFM